MNEVAKSFLETYARGGEVDGGWLFAKALQQAQLDYSDKSLWRLDQLLKAIRERGKPSREAIQETMAGRNFSSLLSYYMIEVVRRRTGAEIDWRDRNSALAEMPKGAQLPDTPTARLIALAPAQGAALMPLIWVEAQVLGNGTLRDAEDFVANLIAMLEQNGPVAWAAGMYSLGRLASYQMMMAADGGSVRPMMLSSTAPYTWEILMAGFPGEDIDAALSHGANRLESNPNSAIWQLLSYDGMMDINGVSHDSVMVILETYGQSPLRLKMAFPYRPAKDGHPFVILKPRLLNANVENEPISKLGSSLERGIQSVKWVFGTTWDELLEDEDQLGGAPGDLQKEQAIGKLRSAYELAQKRFNPQILASVSAPTPPWMDKRDALNEILRQQSLLLQEGKIVWGALIQANKLLFSPGRDDCPALLVYSADPYFDSRPQELRQIGHSIFSLKDTIPDHPELEEVAQLVSDKMDRSMNFRLPHVLSNREIRAAAFMVFRKHIPTGVLTAGTFPILIHPSTDAVMIVPCEFWPIELIVLWKEGKL
ncbi:MAG TPA: hypothetical protein VIU93_15465 [Gallionellaceae bacterium]